MDSKKWVGMTTANFPAATQEEVWSFVGEFCAPHKWMMMDTCRRVEGEENQPGCVRLCISGVSWAKERLVSFDPVEHRYSYDIVENNMGFGGYLADIKVLPVEEGCRVEWSFKADPVAGWTLDGLLAYFQAAVDALGKAILLNKGK